MFDTVSLHDLLKELGKAPPTFLQTNLISDGSLQAQVTDPNLVNPWGVAFSPTSPFWISENGQGVASIDSVVAGNVTTNVIPPVTIPAPTAGDTSAPTGQVFNPFPDAFKLNDGNPATFLFATEDGTVAGWNGGLGTTAQITVDNSSNPAEGDETMNAGAVYKGLAIGMSHAGPTLYAANFRHGTVDMYDQNFNLIKSFTDPNVPAGFAPFDVKVLHGKLFVTFAQQDAAKHDDVAGPGNGVVDEFSMQGHLIKQVASGGTLNSPWGLAIAPDSFGKLANDLLVGNFGDGTINVFNPHSDKFLGQLTGPDGKPISIDGLWSLTPGNGGSAGDPNKIYFTAGPAGETEGLFGSLSAVGHGAHSF